MTFSGWLVLNRNVMTPPRIGLRPVTPPFRALLSDLGPFEIQMGRRRAGITIGRARHPRAAPRATSGNTRTGDGSGASEASEALFLEPGSQ